MKKTSTHIIFNSWFETPGGERTDLAEHRLHVSRKCSNCAHDGSSDPEYVAEGGVTDYGRCKNWCSAADDENEANQWCSFHQTPAEFAANVNRIDRPVLMSIAE